MLFRVHGNISHVSSRIFSKILETDFCHVFRIISKSQGKYFYPYKPSMIKGGKWSTWKDMEQQMSLKNIFKEIGNVRLRKLWFCYTLSYFRNT